MSGNQNTEGALTWFCLPDSRMRKELSECRNQKELCDCLSKITINNYTSIITCGAYVDFLDDEIYEKMVGNLEDGVCAFTEKLNESYYGYEGKTGFNGIDFIRNKLVDFTYISALRDAVNDMKQQYNPLMTMLRQIETKISESDKEKVNNLISNVNDTIAEVDEVKKLSEGINNKILESVGNTYVPDIMLKSEVSGDIKDIFRKLKIKSKQNKEFDLDTIGLGSTNIIYIALKLMEYSYAKKLEELQSKYFLLLFEEPEAHLHKHIQMALFEKTGVDVNEGIQVLMTTHSDNISASSKISRMNIISKGNKGSRVMQPYIGLTPEEIMHIERYLDVKRSKLLFSKSVILVEGDAEEILIPVMVKKCLGISLDELGVSLINIGSVGFSNIYKLFHDARICKKCAIVSDLDTPIDSSDSGQKNAYERGKERKEELECESKNNQWIRGFFGQYTFEVEMVHGNEEYIDKLIDKTYRDEAAKKNKRVALRDSNVEMYGDVALKLANANKKGWNAVMLAEILDGKCSIPEYILDSLCFVAMDEILEKRNYLKMLHGYGVQYKDTDMLTLIASEPDKAVEEILELIPMENRDKTVPRLLFKEVIE